MSDYFVSDVPPEEIAREKAKARELRESQWWKRRRSTGICHYCGRKFPPRELTMDHVVPIIRGGKSSKGNVVPACKECNSKKKYLLPIEWEEYLASVRSRDEM
jgi:5-methylcytosine-specific restriction endonuclease McrA